MKITIWSDFVCPFCYIGVTHLEKALKDYKDKVEIEYKSFQLEPGAKYEPNKTYQEVMMERKGLSKNDVDGMFHHVDMMAKKAGLHYDFENMKLTDTFLAHRLFQYAKEENKGYAYFDRLYKAFFEEGILISDKEALKKIAHNLELDQDTVTKILADDNAYEDVVNSDIQMARQIGVQGVPFFVFNNKYAISGAQPVEAFQQVLSKVKNES